MDPNTFRLFASSRSPASFTLGEATGGGYFAGYISHSANGIATHALIIAPAETGAGISTFLAAQFCIGLSIGGFTDWYLPSLSELGIAYRNLKPTTQTNSTFYGVNQYSVPLSNSNYSSGTPSQTALTLFQSGNAQAFMANGHWTSTYDSLFNNTHRLSFSNGESPAVSPSGNTGSVRAFRRIAL